MVRKRPFTIRYDSEVKQHFRAIERKYHALIRTTIDEQLRYEPLVETENRKPLQRPVTFGATWEVRLGPNNRFRVYYRVDEETYEMLILAVGEKKRDRVYIGGEEYPL
jgi:mRNA-degrading endonuclease RelE of RelBE toxin-antitoxin system